MSTTAPAVPPDRRRRAWPYRWTLWLALPAVLCLLVYWNGFTAWFLMDDYAWLGLRMEVQSLGDLFHVLFRPQAQGTVRVFSERLFFLAFSTVFGMDALPFKMWIFFTHFLNLFLLGWLTFRLTGSRIAAVAAPSIWTLNAALMVPLSWVSSYNQILWTFCLLAGLLTLIRYTDTGQRAWLALCWVIYLAGFGVLELNVVFPAVALLFAGCCAPARWRAALPFFIPALLFAWVHFTLIPKQPDPAYAMHFDGALFTTFYKYLAYATGPSRLGGLVDEQLRRPGYAVTAIIGVGMLAFSLALLRRGDKRPVFLMGWFVLTLAPVLPLREHRMEYYLTAPTAGLAILTAWAFAWSWKAHRAAGIAAAVVLAAYAAGMYALIAGALEWRHDNSLRLRDLLFAVSQTMEDNPKPVVLLSGVDHDLYAAGFNDRPFRLVTSAKIYLTPGSEVELKQPRHALRAVDDYVISERDAARALGRGEAVVLHAEGGRIRNITTRYAAIAHAKFKNSEQRRIDVGLPGSEENLGPSWYPVEQGFRWMPRSATVRLAGPDRPGSMLRIEGYGPASVLGRGAVKLSAKIDGLPLGSVQISRPNERFSSTFEIPNRLVGRPAVTVEVSVDRTHQEPGGRELGMVFGTFEIAPPSR